MIKLGQLRNSATITKLHTMITDILAELSVFAERFPKIFMFTLRCTWSPIVRPNHVIR